MNWEGERVNPKQFIGQAVEQPQLVFRHKSVNVTSNLIPQSEPAISPEGSNNVDENDIAYVALTLAHPH